MTMGKKHFIPLESDPELFTGLIHELGMSRRLAFHDLLTLSPPDSNDSDDNDGGGGSNSDSLLASVPRPALALIVVIPAPEGYTARLAEEETDVVAHDGRGDEERVMFYHQTIGNACGLYATLHAVSNGEARAFVEPGTHIARLIEQCTPLGPEGRIAALEADARLAAAHAAAASRGCTAPPADITVPALFAYMTFVKARRGSGRLYQVEGCRKAPVDLGCELAADEDLLSRRALNTVRGFIEKAGNGVTHGYSAMALCVTEGAE
ncbi:putative ubiquitin carboxyl-terminal hydrolase isozyme l3 protein [Rosellinia necatrix]|uniref:ubiquitinyl hydrolase 1 n=1 Tax=Rosellinia necatrix TaxID=77044 RepID=A0A1S7UKU3_ROSNE|nr:putative ubiquitin carboxyl-terminal hydrolase isozyme l3 protein [Rosellinia necatrix]